MLNKTKPLISVIIPIFNTADLIERCLNSIINNSYNRLEIICVNDGSTDNSLSILKEYEKTDNRIKIINTVNGGVSKARNRALSVATGDFIAFIDSDDWIHEDFFKILVDTQSRFNSDITSCGFIRTQDYLADVSANTNDILVKKYIGAEILTNHNLKSFIWGKIYRGNLLKDCRFIEGIRIAEDKAFNLQIISSNSQIEGVEVSKSLYYYYYRKDSAINNSSGIDFMKLSRVYLDGVKNTKDQYARYIYLHEAFVNTITSRYLTMYIPDESVKSEINQYVTECLCYEKQYKPFSKKTSLRLVLMAKIPILYRGYRIITDRTMLDWEKNERKKYRQ